MSDLNNLLFGIYPYIAFAIFVVGCLARYDREQYTWKTGSSQLLESKLLKKGSKAFHVGVICILAGHFVGLLTPHVVWDVLGVSLSFKQAVAMGAGGLFGLICLYGISFLIYRRLFNERVRASSSTMDTLVLILLGVQLVLGLLSIFVSAGHMDGHEMLKMMHWAQNIVTLNGSVAAAEIAGIHWIYKLHIVLGMTIILLFPFGRLVHIWSVPVKYFGRNYQVVRTKRA